MIYKAKVLDIYCVLVSVTKVFGNFNKSFVDLVENI